MSGLMWWFDLVSAALWFTLAAVGIVLRTRRLIRLRRIVLVEPASDRDRDYLASVKRSTYLRLFVKFVFLVGALIALFHVPLFGLWRVGLIAALAFMIWETINVDSVRDRLGRSAEDEP